MVLHRWLQDVGRAAGGVAEWLVRLGGRVGLHLHRHRAAAEMRLLLVVDELAPIVVEQLRRLVARVLGAGPPVLSRLLARLLEVIGRRVSERVVWLLLEIGHTPEMGRLVGVVLAGRVVSRVRILERRARLVAGHVVSPEELVLVALGDVGAGVVLQCEGRRAGGRRRLEGVAVLRVQLSCRLSLLHGHLVQLAVLLLRRVGGGVMLLVAARRLCLRGAATRG